MSFDSEQFCEQELNIKLLYSCYRVARSRHTRTPVPVTCRKLCTNATPPKREILTELSDFEFEVRCEETLDSLAMQFDELNNLDISNIDCDVQYSSGVLTVKLGEDLGTYVINKQTPNKQIWLSSPSSGPKRYDFVDGRWIYKHDGITLHSLLSREFSETYNIDIDLMDSTHKQTTPS